MSLHHRHYPAPMLASSALAMSLALTGGHRAQAYPSYDCQHARSPAEVAVCEDVDAARADAQMSTLYQGALRRLPAGRREQLRQSQRAWIRSVYTVGPAAPCNPHGPKAPTDTYADCIAGQYRARIETLKALLDAPRAEQLTARDDAAVQLKAGERIGFNDLEIDCGRTQAEILMGGDGENTKAINRLDGYGYLAAAHADCRMDNGEVIRIKAGFQSAPLPYGMCGASPPEMLSIWVGRRKVLSRQVYETCMAYQTYRITVRAHQIELCDAAKPTDTDSPGDPPRPGACHRLYPRPAWVDQNEFPGRTKATRPVDSLAVTASAEFASTCQSLIDPKAPSAVRVPPSLRQPVWASVKGGGSGPDSAKLGFNATSIRTAEAAYKSARFDLFNTGRPQSVYAVDSGNHWFDGTAFAAGRADVVNAAFDAHDWPRSTKAGVFPFVYAHATAFFHGGKTYLLLDPSLPTASPAVVRFDGHLLRTACTLARRQENF